MHPSWPEVDPVRHPFDPAAVDTVVRGLAPAADVPVRPAAGSADEAVTTWADTVGRSWADAMDAALAGHYGRWTFGWRWAHTDGRVNRGPVGAWCCPRDSMGTPDESLTAVIEALIEWRAWLDDLAERFGRFVPLSADPAEARDTWERAVAHLVTVVVERTGASTAWYQHCELVLTWFLTAAGVAGTWHQELIAEAIGGRFRSWVVAPEDNLAGADHA